MTECNSNLLNLQIGDKVQVECYSGLGTGGEDTVTDLTYRYDRNSGEPYPVIILENGHEFDATTGNAVTPPTAYYISHKI